MNMSVDQESQRATLGPVGWVCLTLGGVVMLAPFYP